MNLQVLHVILCPIPYEKAVLPTLYDLYYVHVFIIFYYYFIPFFNNDVDSYTYFRVGRY